MRTQWEKSKAVSASRRLYVPDRRVSNFSNDCLIDVCPSQRGDAFWIVVAGQTLKPRTDLVLADDLSDFVAYDELPIDGLNRIIIPSAPKSRSPYERQGKWRSLVYFVQGVDGGPIKIGYTTDIGSRLLALQAHSPVMLRTLSCFPATQDDEKALHDAFRHCHSHLEWFHPDSLLVFFSKSFRFLYPHLAEKTVQSDLLELKE